MFSLLISLILNSNNDLPVLKFTPSLESNTIIVLKDEKPNKAFFYEDDLPVAKESISFEIVKFHPLKRTVDALKKSLSEVSILPRRGSVVKFSNGSPVLEDKIVTRIEINKIISPVEQKSSREESKYMIFEDRRLFSGRLRSRVFIGGR